MNGSYQARMRDGEGPKQIKKGRKGQWNEARGIKKKKKEK
jgi:hypothetical protein